MNALCFPALNDARRAALASLAELVAGDDDAVMRALKLGPRQRDEVDVDRAVESSATMPAVERFDGVLFDALDVASLPAAVRGRAADRLLIASALFGVVGAEDAIPAYRLGPDASLPGATLKKRWIGPLGHALAQLPGLIIDLRSEAYRALGPIPARDDVVVPRLVSEGEGGVRRALNHFNKAGKGRFTRDLLAVETAPSSRTDLLDWASGAGWKLETRDDGGLDLVV